MTPMLSIIIPNYNHAQQLPSLLDSIVSQSMKNLEVIIVDDCSTDGCADIVEAYQNKSLNLVLYASAERLYTKNARLKGIELAQGKIIAFADADDYFWGTETLESLVQQYVEASCDVLQFQTLRVNQQGKQSDYNAWANPFANELKGAAIFEEYSSWLPGHVMWNKLYSRQIWMEHLDAARKIPITICSEDLFLSSFYLFHAKHYIGSRHVGYGHTYTDKLATKSAGRAAALFIMLREFVPYLRQRNCPLSSVKNISRYLEGRCVEYANRACLEAVSGAPHASDPQTRAKAFADIPVDLLVDMLLYVNGNNARWLTDWARSLLFSRT